jgi:hypothetical protein
MLLKRLRMQELQKMDPLCGLMMHPLRALNDSLIPVMSVTEKIAKHNEHPTLKARDGM